jgi:hypothetical protein
MISLPVQPESFALIVSQAVVLRKQEVVLPMTDDIIGHNMSDTMLYIS